ncbi:hypothetical protein KC887_04360 [Candidatus Kaiserbacteria bacterium]|nr:hypothetical protein [Candidatus Kaiserbacteria bacterium]
MRTIKNINDLFQNVCFVTQDVADSVSDEVCLRKVGRAIYKNTSCGAFVELASDVEGVVVGSIIEGYDAQATNHTLAFPFGSDEFWQAVESVESEVDEILADLEAQVADDEDWI